MAEQYKVVRGNILVDKDRVSHHIPDGHIEKSFRVINCSRETVMMCSTDGSIVYVTPSRNNPHRNSIIIVHRTYAHNGEIEWLNFVEDKDMQRVQASSIQKGYIEWEEEIDINLILEHKSGVFVNSCDLVFTTDYKKAKEVHHYRCKQKVHNDYLQATTQFNPDDVISVSVRVNDNSGEMGTLYTVFHNKTLRLIPIADPILDDGVYVSGFTDIDAANNRTIRKDEYYSFADVYAGKAPIRLYSSIREANEAKDTRILKELEVIESAAKREHEQKMAEQKREFEVTQLQHEKDLKEMERLLKEKDAVLSELRSMRDNEYHAQKHYRNMESDRYQMSIDEYKARQENLSNSNKMFTEVIKTVGLIATGVVAAKTLFG